MCVAPDKHQCSNAAYCKEQLIVTKATFHLQKDRLSRRTDSNVGREFKLEKWLKAREKLQHEDTVTKHVTRTDTQDRSGMRQILNTRNKH